jgi:hypothetical protein
VIKPSAILQLIFGCVALLASEVASAELLETVPVSLSTADRTSIVDLVCREPVGVSAESVRARRATGRSNNGRRSIFVHVVCGAHTAVLGHNVKRIADCDNYVGRWSCTSGEFLQYGEWPGPDYLELHGGDDVAIALEVVKSLLLWRTFRGHDLVFAMQGICSLYLKSKDRWELVCGVTTITVERECRSDSCRFEPVDISIVLV